MARSDSSPEHFALRPPTADEAELYRRVITLANALPVERRPRMALVVAPEGIELISRGVLAERLRAAGLDRQARDVFRLAKDSYSHLLCWTEGEDQDGAAVARLGTLCSPGARRRSQAGRATKTAQSASSREHGARKIHGSPSTDGKGTQRSE